MITFLILFVFFSFVVMRSMMKAEMVANGRYIRRPVRRGRY